jgi:hypothetical protein
MKLDFDLNRRAIAAELHRRRAALLRKNAVDRSLSAVRQEMEAEASLHEEYADGLMDYTDTSEKIANVTPNPRADLDQADAPQSKKPVELPIER